MGSPNWPNTAIQFNSSSRFRTWITPFNTPSSFFLFFSEIELFHYLWFEPRDRVELNQIKSIALVSLWIRNCIFNFLYTEIRTQIPLFPPSCKSLHKKLRPFRKPSFFCNLLSQTSQRYSILAHDSTFFHGTIFSMSCMCLGF